MCYLPWLLQTIHWSMSKWRTKPKPSSVISFHRTIYWYTKPGCDSLWNSSIIAFFKYWGSRTTFFHAEWIISGMRILSLIKCIDKSRIYNLSSPLNVLRSELNITTIVISIRRNGVEEQLPQWKLSAISVRNFWKMLGASIRKCSRLKRSLNGDLLRAWYRKWRRRFSIRVNRQCFYYKCPWDLILVG